MKINVSLIAAGGALALLAALGMGRWQPSADATGWWPVQRAPRAYVVASEPKTPAEQMLLYALSGLAAQAVNEGRGDELVWIGQDFLRMGEWRERTVARLGLRCRGTNDVWQLLTRYRAAGWVRGYVLYTPDTSPGRAYEPRTNVNDSANAATALCGLLRAVPATPELERRLQALGLQPLGDARALTPADVRRTHGDRLNRRLLSILDPQTAVMRDMAVAHRSLVVYGTNATWLSALDWAAPLAPVLGWNGGDEFRHTEPLTRRAHFQTASNWARNLPLLSAGSRRAALPKLAPLDPATIDWSDRRAPLAFVMSDGDNLGFLLGGFWGARDPAGRSGGSYWEHPAHGRFPMGWTACLGDLVDVAPAIVERLAETQPAQSTLIQFTGGYFYPDLFAANLPNRAELLRRQARRINAQMRRCGATVLNVLMSQSDSPAGQEALRLFAEEIHPLLGITVLDYAPYHRMHGRVWWLADGRGGEVPAIAARYSMWANMRAPGAGGPAELARAINAAGATNAAPAWVAVHAWSSFTNAATGRLECGMGPVAACAEALNTNHVKVVSPEELFWRLRMAHAPDATRRAITAYNKERP